MSSAPEPAVAIDASEAPLRAKQTGYPQPYAARVSGREKRPLGDLFGLTNFGVNLTRLEPGCVSSIRHCHTKQDEFIYILRGNPVLVTNGGETELAPGMCAGFAKPAAAMRTSSSIPVPTSSSSWRSGTVPATTRSNTPTTTSPPSSVPTASGTTRPQGWNTLLTWDSPTASTRRAR